MWLGIVINTRRSNHSRRAGRQCPIFHCVAVEPWSSIFSASFFIGVVPEIVVRDGSLIATCVTCLIYEGSKN